MPPDRIAKLVRTLPLADSCTLLALSVIEANPGAVAPVLGLIAFAERMAQDLTPRPRAEVACALRDAADEVERGLMAEAADAHQRSPLRH